MRTAIWFAMVPDGHEETGFLAEERGGALFQFVDRGVFAEDVVADRGGRHGREHRRAWAS